MINGDLTTRIGFAIANAREAQKNERLLLGLDRPAYCFTGRKVKCGDDLAEATMDAMRDNAEAVLLVNGDGQPMSLLINDGMGNLRESRL